MTRPITLVIFVLLALPAGAEVKKPRDLIYGKWESQDSLSKGVLVEYKKDGTTTATFNGKTISTGKFKFVEDDVMEFESDLPQALGLKSRVKIMIADDVLTRTDLNTKIEMKLKRVK